MGMGEHGHDHEDDLERFRCAIGGAFGAAMDHGHIEEESARALYLCVMVAARVELLGENTDHAQAAELVRWESPN